MTQYSLEPLIGVRPVLLGMTRGESREHMVAKPVSFKKAPRLFPNQPDVDAYHGNAFQLFFDESDRVEYIELSKSPDLGVNYKGTDVFALAADDLVALISRDAPFDSNDRELGYSYTFPLLEMSVWRPTIPEPDDVSPEWTTFATVGIGRKGYFSKGIAESTDAAGSVIVDDEMGRVEAGPPCPRCGKPLRTKKAEQCFECGADWHEQSSNKA